jgi:hypothetical protein
LSEATGRLPRSEAITFAKIKFSHRQSSVNPV